MKLENDLPGCPCPHCGKLLDDATEISGSARPSPGDAGLCWYCGFVLIYTPTLEVREARAADFLGFSSELGEKIVRLILAWRQRQKDLRE
jgi:hypothetical protein